MYCMYYTLYACTCKKKILNFIKINDKHLTGRGHEKTEAQFNKNHYTK